MLLHLSDVHVRPLLRSGRHAATSARAVTAARSLACALALALMATACQVPPRLPLPDLGPPLAPADPAAPGAPADPCHPWANRSCGLPFPSDSWTAPDPGSATGRLVELPDEVLTGGARDELPASLVPSTVLRGADGFSAAGPVVLETVGPADATTVQVWDLTARRRVPVTAATDREADLRGAGGTIVTAWPRSRFEFGHRHVAVAAGSPGPRLAAALADPDAELRAALELLAANGVEPSSIGALTTWTVRSEANVRAPFDAMLGRANRTSTAVRGVTVAPNLLGIESVTSIVTGQLRTLDLRDPTTGEIDPAVAHPEWIDFLMTVPDSARRAAVPVLIYGHGIAVSKETSLFAAGRNAAAGAATIAIDQPNHGSRIAADGGHIFDLIAPGHAGRLLSIATQSAIDLTMLRRTVAEQLTTLDSAPFDLIEPMAADGRADLDTSSVHYQASSMGAVLGSAFVANDPGIRSVNVRVAGAGVMSVLTRSSLWEANVLPGAEPFRAMVPTSATAADAALFVALAQAAIDPSDGINGLHRLAERGTPLQLVYAVGDRVVPNVATNAFMELAGLRLTGERFAEVDGVDHVAGIPVGRSAAYQSPAAEVDGLLRFPVTRFLADLLSHDAGRLANTLDPPWWDAVLTDRAPAGTP